MLSKTRKKQRDISTKLIVNVSFLVVTYRAKAVVDALRL